MLIANTIGITLNSQTLELGSACMILGTRNRSATSWKWSEVEVIIYVDLIMAKPELYIDIMTLFLLLQGF